MPRLPNYYRGEFGETSLELPMDAFLIRSAPIDFIVLINTGQSCVAAEVDVTSAERQHSSYGYTSHHILNLRGHIQNMNIVKGEDDPRFVD